MTKNNGGPAFPSGDGELSGCSGHEYGMSLRDWFAGKSLIGILSNSKYGESDKWFSDKAERAYFIADAMLKAREE